jgi:siroheme decarboxylase
VNLADADRRIVAALQAGIEPVERPFQVLATQAGCSEADVIERIAALQQDGVIRRLGLIVRHRKLGYTANAMVVWDVPDAEVDAVARQLADSNDVALCYRRPRRLPQWRYNLFCMLFGRTRDEVLVRLQRLVADNQLGDVAHEVLFSTRCFKQTGGRYV